MTLPDEPPLPGCLSAALGLLLALALCGLAATCLAQPTEVLVARTFISEEGWDSAEGWASLGAVIRWRAASHHDGDLRAATVALSPRLHGGCMVATRRWRCHLLGLERPAGLGATWTAPRALGRPSRRDAWAAALGAARALLDGALPDACREEPHAWGSAADVALRVRAGERWVDAGCPGRNRFGRRLVRR